MMDVMVRRNEDEPSIRPDIDTINDLVEFANSRGDAYAAERYVALGGKRGMTANARTYMLQIDYRVRVGDLDGATVAYNALQGQEVAHGEDVPAINRLLRALCAAKKLPHSTIVTMASDLSERRARLEPATLSALCIMHLRREELFDASDMLQSHAFHYSAAQRAEVLGVLATFCLDRGNSTARAWDAYSILRQVFDETSIELRTRLMLDFFDRRRSDMACHVFGHMRQSFRPEGRPVVSTYVDCLTGIARRADLEGLEMVHNMLKLDSSIEPCTRLSNALMLAYAATDMPQRSLDFWDDVVRSREGPNYASIVIALQACERLPAGDTRARKIWARLRAMDVRVNADVAAAFVGALAGQGLFGEVVKLVDGLERDLAIPVDSLMLAPPCSAEDVVLTMTQSWQLLQRHPGPEHQGPGREVGSRAIFGRVEGAGRAGPSETGGRHDALWHPSGRRTLAHPP